MAINANGSRYTHIMLQLTDSDYQPIVEAAGGEEHVVDFIITAAVKAAKEVKSEGI